MILYLRRNFYSVCLCQSLTVKRKQKLQDLKKAYTFLSHPISTWIMTPDIKTSSHVFEYGPRIQNIFSVLWLWPQTSFPLFSTLIMTSDIITYIISPSQYFDYDPRQYFLFSRSSNLGDKTQKWGLPCGPKNTVGLWGPGKPHPHLHMVPQWEEGEGGPRPHSGE